MTAPDPLRKNHVTVTGRGDAPRSLVFVHGFGTDQSAWQQVQDAFRDDFRIVRFDNTGAGRSDRAAFRQHRYLNLHAYAADLLDICSALQLRQVTLVGHSVGGMCCVLAAIARPELFDRLVLVGASPRYLDDAGYRGGFTQADLNALYSAVTLSYTEWAGRFAAAAMGNPGQPELAEYFAGTIKSIPPELALTVLCSIFQSDHRADLARLDLPTLLIQARDDVAVPLEVAEFMHRQIRGSQLRVIDAAGHLPHVSAPAAVIEAMSDFVRA